jgi:hypothetical protein
MKKSHSQQEASDREIARLRLILSRLPLGVVEVLTVHQLIRCFEIRLHPETVRHVKNEYQATQEEEMSKRKVAKSEDVDAQTTLERLARIASKTEPVLGPDEKLSEHDAVVMIVRELRNYDEAIINRNIRRVLPKQTVEVKEQ